MNKFKWWLFRRLVKCVVKKGELQHKKVYKAYCIIYDEDMKECYEDSDSNTRKFLDDMFRGAQLGGIRIWY